MKHSRIYDDGQTIELDRSGNGNPPGSDPSRQHTNASTNWVRLNSGPWRNLETRSIGSALVYLEASETAEECMAALLPTGGGRVVVKGAERQGDEMIENMAGYDPPENPSFLEAYDLGFAAGRTGQPESACPYQPSGHERDTTFVDDRCYQWWRGWVDYEGPRPEVDDGAFSPDPEPTP